MHVDERVCGVLVTLGQGGKKDFYTYRSSRPRDVAYHIWRGPAYTGPEEWTFLAVGRGGIDTHRWPQTHVTLAPTPEPTYIPPTHGTQIRRLRHEEDRLTAFNSRGRRCFIIRLSKECSKTKRVGTYTYPTTCIVHYIRTEP